MKEREPITYLIVRGLFASIQNPWVLGITAVVLLCGYFGYTPQDLAVLIREVIPK